MKKRDVWMLLLSLGLALVLVSCTPNGADVPTQDSGTSQASSHPPEETEPTENPTEERTEAEPGTEYGTEPETESVTEPGTEVPEPTLISVSENGLWFVWLEKKHGWALDGTVGLLAEGHLTVPSQIGGDPVLQISEYAMKNCAELTVLEIPDSVESIGRFAFWGCTSLREVRFGTESRLASVGERAFEKCTALQTFFFPHSVKRIGNAALAECTSLTSLSLSSKCDEIPSRLLARTAVEEIEIPYGVTEIGSSAFSECVRLHTVFFPETVTYIRDGAFAGCTSLTSLALPEGELSLGSNVFASCTSLTSLTLPEGVLSLGSNAFANCTSLSSVSLAEGLTKIGKGAFDSCAALESLVLPDSVKEIGRNAFRGCPLLTETVDGVDYLGTWAVGVDPEVTSVTVRPGTRAIVGNCFSYCDALTEILLPEGLERIGYAAFSHCAALEEVVLPNGMTALDGGVFADCHTLKRIVIPDTVTAIAPHALMECTALEDLTVPFLGRSAAYEDAQPISWLLGTDEMPSCECGWVNPNYKEFSNNCLKRLTVTGGAELSAGVFEGCRALERVTLGATVIGSNLFEWASAPKQLILCEGVLRVERNAVWSDDSLFSSGLRSFLVLPRSLVAVQKNAFADFRTSEVFYLGTPEEWAILSESIGEGNAVLRNVHFYSETPPEDEAELGLHYWRYVDGEPVAW